MSEGSGITEWCGVYGFLLIKLTMNHTRMGIAFSRMSIVGLHIDEYIFHMYNVIMDLRIFIAQSCMFL